MKKIIILLAILGLIACKKEKEVYPKSKNDCVEFPEDSLRRCEGDPMPVFPVDELE